MRARLPVTLLLALLTGCSFNRYELGKPIDNWSDQERPENLAQALDTLGPPLRVSRLPGGFALAWEHWQISETKLGLSLRPLGLEFLSIDWGDARTQGEFLLLTFDTEHQVVDARFDRWDNNAGSGQGVQALVSVVDVVDVDDLTERLPYHRWGSLALEPPPVTLNRDQSMYQGSAGLQQRGTPDVVGQHSLQMGRGD
ncbi:MAG: hypothetical protein AAGI11_14030 [Pseudomonadota bacterium]